MQIKYINRYPDAIVVGVRIYPAFSRQSDQIPFSLLFGAQCSLFFFAALVGMVLLRRRHQWRLLLLFVMVIVNVYDSVCWFGCAHQKLDKLLYYFGFCSWDLFCVFCSMNCLQTSEFNSLTLSVCLSVCLFLPYFLSLFPHRLLHRRNMALFSRAQLPPWCSLCFHSSLYSSLYTNNTGGAIVVASKLMNSRESQLYPITIIIRFDI